MEEKRSQRERERESKINEDGRVFPSIHSIWDAFMKLCFNNNVCTSLQVVKASGRQLEAVANIKVCISLLQTATEQWRCVTTQLDLRQVTRSRSASS